MFIFANNRIKSLLFLYRGQILYILFGILTTIVNIIVYILLSYLFSINYFVSNIIAWISAIIFAYFTNKKYVFGSSAQSTLEIGSEFIRFVIYRLLTGFTDILLMWFGIDIIMINDIYVKIATNIIVIILNYIISKNIIFTYNK